MLAFGRGRLAIVAPVGCLGSPAALAIFYNGLRLHSTCVEDRPAGGLNKLKSRRPSGKPDMFALPTTPARTRFAPSPTGYLHLGSLRTALYNYLMARATGGQFIVRVEDTDRTRIVPDAEERLFDDLKWAQLDWDEAPDVGGPLGPYRQSDRLDHYHKYANELFERGKAYRCFCSSEDLERHKEHAATNRQSTNYPGTCRAVTPEESNQRAANGETHVLRFKAEGIVPTMDRVYGRYTKNEKEDDFILIKSDKYPTYHFANVIDDYLMKITHVIRGAEWLISTPKHVALYNAFGWTPPEFAHVGLLTNKNGHKLSKRNHDIDISSYRQQGVIPSALNNWVALLGWSMGSGQNEVVKNLEELVKKFSFKFTKGNIKVNMDKLQTFEHRHLKNLVSEEPPNHELLNKVLLDVMYTTIKNIDTNENDPSRGPLLAPFATLESARTYMIRIFRENTTKYSKNINVLTQNPALVWSIPPSVYGEYLGLHSRSPETAQIEYRIVVELKAGLSAISTEAWGVAELSRSLSELIARLNESVPQGNNNMMIATHSCVRFAMMGGHTVPSKASSLVLDLLGKEESLKRLDNAIAAYENIL